MRKLLLILQLVSITVCASAQSLLSIEDALIKNRTTLAPENLRQIQFIYGTEDYAYLKKTGSQDVWVRGNLSSGEQAFLTLDQLNQKLRAAGKDTVNAMPA